MERINGLTTSAACRELECSPTWLRRLVNGGEIRAVRTPYGRVVDAEALARFKRDRDQRREAGRGAVSAA